MNNHSSNNSTISVVIAWVNPLELLEHGLDALLQSSLRKPDEIIVATRHNAREQERFRSRYPDVALLSAPSNAPITSLRSLGAKHAKGDIIVVTEDHCVPCEEWLSLVEKRINDGYSIVGGPVENACKSRLRDWAAFLTEYAFAILPETGVSEATTDPCSLIPSNNVAYRRELLNGLCETLDRGQWESFYLTELNEPSIRMAYEPRMVVFHRRPFDFWYFLGQRYHFCRSFAGMRCLAFSAKERIKYGLGSVLLPPFLLWRGLRTVTRKRRLIGRYLSCLPLITTYIIVGAMGEMTGYFLGGGTSLQKVE